jgi:hypothetical protein
MGVSLGHGISDSVRDCISSWMTDKVINLLYEEAKPTISKWNFGNKLRSSSEWKRISRRRSDKVGVWSRSYYSKLLGKNQVGLIVLTNKKSSTKEEDMYIEYVTITLKGKVIGGGKVSVPSVKLSQKNKQVNIEDFKSESLFTEFTASELANINSEIEYGEEGMMLVLFEERI